MSQLRLRFNLPGSGEQVLSVDRPEFTLGRSLDCDLCLNHSGVSRRHTRIFRRDAGDWLAEDLDSRNGTLVNGRYLHEPQALHHGDLLTLGSTTVQVLLTDSQLAETPALRATADLTFTRSAAELKQRWIESDPAVVPRETAVARLQDLLEIAKALSQAAAIDEIFQSACQVVFRYLASVERLALLVDVSGTGELRMLNASVRGGGHLHASDSGDWLSRSICEQAFRDQAAVQTADAQSDSRFDGMSSIVEKGIRTAMAVPLWTEDRVVGVFYADARQRAFDWTHRGEDDLSFFSALANLVAASVQRWLLTERLRGEEQLRRQLLRYHSPSVVEHLLATPEETKAGALAPRDCEISIFFADIVGFTALSERLSPAGTAQLLNALFSEMLEEIFAAGGTLDKFIGDAIMAFFGAPTSQPDHADRAVGVALSMLGRLNRLNDAKVFDQPLQLRIGINTGTAVVGDVGSPERVDYTALGPTVNLASRMEEICPPGSCLISESTFGALTDKSGWIDYGEHQFRGIERPVRLFRK